MTQTPIEKMFQTVYDWGRAGVMTDSHCFAFEEEFKEAVIYSLLEKEMLIKKIIEEGIKK